MYRLIQSTINFSRLVAHNFVKDDCAYRASALAFVTLLAIVPLLIVVLSVFSSFPTFQNLKMPLQNFIFANFVPNTGKLIQIHLEQFVHQVADLSIFGVLFLFFTAFLMMITIERSMNTIWRVHTHRTLVNALLLYWAILSLAPIFVGLSLIATSYLFCFSLFANQQVPPLFLSLSPYLLSFISFTFLYAVVPNYRVKLLHACIGGAIATLLFESTKFSFAYYLSHFNFYQLIYGAFAAIPIFFIWIYWVWIVTLLGAEVSYALSVSPEHFNTAIQKRKHNANTHRTN